jgi:hypothetical protein
MKTNIHFSPYLTHFFLERERFQRKFVGKIKTNVLGFVCVCVCVCVCAVHKIKWKNFEEPAGDR